MEYKSKVDYASVITKEELQQMNPIEYEYAKKESNQYYNAITRLDKIRVADRENILELRAYEIAYNSEKYAQKDILTKTIISTNIAFNNDSKFINALLSKGITYERLDRYTTLITKLNKICLFAESLNLEDDLQSNANKYIAYVCSIIRLYFGTRDYTLIANKLNETVVFNKDLYLQLQQTKTR